MFGPDREFEDWIDRWRPTMQWLQRGVITGVITYFFCRTVLESSVSKAALVTAAALIMHRASYGRLAIEKACVVAAALLFAVWLGVLPPIQEWSLQSIASRHF